MKQGRNFAILALAAFATCAAASPARHRAGNRAAAHDWSRTVATTAEGGFRMGNPAAKVKLIEYGSLTCSHCGHFAREAVPVLIARYIRPGKVSYEYRNMVLNGLDVAAVVVARCAGPAAFFKIAERLYADQDAWMKRAESASVAEKARIEKLPAPRRMSAIAALAGLGRYAALGGVTAQRARQCLADPGAVDRLGRMYEAGARRGVEGTPTFFINGAKADVNVWPDLEPLIVRAGG